MSLELRESVEPLFFYFSAQVEQVPSVPDGGRLQGESDSLRPDGGSNRRHAGAVQICPHQVQRANVHQRHGHSDEREHAENGVRETSTHTPQCLRGSSRSQLLSCFCNPNKVLTALISETK